MMPAVHPMQPLAMLVLVLSIPMLVWAQGPLGKRELPTTLVIEDPSVADELSLLIGHIKEPGEGGESPSLVSELTGRYAKRLTPSLALTLSGTFRHLNPDEGSTENGFGNLEFGAKYELLTSARHEAVVSLALDVELGGTGKRDVGAASFSTISPAIVFGKGFGDLPEVVNAFKPLAITGILGLNVPTRGKDGRMRRRTALDDGAGLEPEVERNPVTLSWGFSLQYHLSYLPEVTGGAGLGSPFNQLIPLVEIPLETCLNRGCGGQTTGTINPGVVWVGKSLQLGLEAVIPMNSRSGKNVGVLGLVHFFFEELFPESLGRTIFGHGG